MTIQDPSVTSKRQIKGVQIKTLLPASFQQKRTRRRLGGCKYLPQKNIFSNFLTLQLFVPKNRRLGGYTLWDQFLQNCTRCTQRKKNPEDAKTRRPSGFLCQIARGSGATLTECTFHEKVHISQKEETKKNISRFHIKKNPDQVYNNSALEAQSWNARGLVDGEPYGPP